MRNIFKNPFSYFALVLIFFILILFVILVFPGSNRPAEEETPIIPLRPSPSGNVTFSPVITPVLTTKVPLKPISEGGGVDLQSTLVQNSQTEIKKLLPFLPYEANLPLADNISISIPGAQFQTTPWILDANIYGTDYLVSETDPDYQIQKKQFLKATDVMFNWMQSKGIDPSQIIINWGDRAYIRERAEEWLNQ